jgi:hydroxymethylbilane synthase
VRLHLHRAFPTLKLEIRVIKTSGDKFTSASLARSGIKGIFTRELEQALLRRTIDLAVHSLKDMPTECPSGLILAVMLEREDPCDVLVAVDPGDLVQPRALHTSSPRRAFQASLLWPGCRVKEIRGNIETRLQKLADAGPGNSLLLAAAGLKRLDYLQKSSKEGMLHFEPSLRFLKLNWDQMIPASGQGVVAVQIREGDGETDAYLRCLNHAPTHSAAVAERSFLRGVGGGCAAPIAAHAQVKGEILELRAVVAYGAGKVWRGECAGKRTEDLLLGSSLSEQYLRERR